MREVGQIAFRTSCLKFCFDHAWDVVVAGVELEPF